MQSKRKTIAITGIVAPALSMTIMLAHAKQAFASQTPSPYDLILTDIRMPKMNGFDLYRSIREMNASIPIAFITAFEINEDEFSKVMPSINVRDFIKKPIRILGLIQKLKGILWLRLVLHVSSRLSPDTSRVALSQSLKLARESAQLSSRC